MHMHTVDMHTASKATVARVRRAEKLAIRLSECLDGSELETVVNALVMLTASFLVLTSERPVDAMESFVKVLQANVLSRLNIESTQ